MAVPAGSRILKSIAVRRTKEKSKWFLVWPDEIRIILPGKYIYTVQINKNPNDSKNELTTNIPNKFKYDLRIYRILSGTS